MRKAALALVLAACGGSPLSDQLAGTWEERADVGFAMETLALSADGTYRRDQNIHPTVGYAPEAGTWSVEADGLRLVREGSAETDRWEMGDHLRIWWTIAIPTEPGSRVVHEYARK